MLNLKSEKLNKLIVIHYHEIALKGGNRAYFEKKLCTNIKEALSHLEYEKIERLWGRVIVRFNERSDFSRIKAKLLKVFGIAYFFKALETDSNFKNLKKHALEVFDKELGEKKFKTFKIKTRRTDKNYSLTSQEINEKIGEHVLKKNTNLKVKLNDPDHTLYIDILGNSRVFIYFHKIKGLGGLPVGTASKVISLISSGFDSPVAAFQIIKRGARVSFVHFHSYPQTSRASLNNVKKIIKKLNQYQFKSTLYLVPFLDIQKEIHLKCSSSLRVILYRRLMVKIAERIAEQEKAKALITGESLGQVASQTLENIQAIDKAATLPVFRPLIGTDKEDIIKQSKKIGTFEISKIPYEDCCSLFVPKHPETKARLKDVLNEEKKLNMEKMIDKSLAETEKVIF